MGYTHYCQFKAEPDAGIWRQFIRDTSKVLSLSGVPLCKQSADPSAPAMFGESVVRFNGKGSEGYEDFMLERRNGYAHSCKTNRRPYDVCVVATLMLASASFGDVFSWWSDGTVRDMQPAIDLLARIGCKVTLADGFGPDDKLTQATSPFVYLKGKPSVATDAGVNIGAVLASLSSAPLRIEAEDEIFA